jgi:hypothetical protein
MKSCRKAWYWLYWLLKSSLYDLAAGQRGRRRLGPGGSVRWVSADLVLQIGKVCIDLLERSNLALNHVDLSSSRTASVSLLHIAEHFQNCRAVTTHKLYIFGSTWRACLPPLVSSLFDCLYK